ncbi:hypothetical protein K2173_028398 [Erythroxylum novogranatense]|uniref:Uncharacterized protein n=1 Tax=Erythroxylum novogranatense TaxID=1862640 RepID=A0AAV8U324_9ROSI|nr:hypothetical protein K2173_028398 [Erythroxylum novogranatense]
MEVVAKVNCHYLPSKLHLLHDHTPGITQKPHFLKSSKLSVFTTPDPKTLFQEYCRRFHHCRPLFFAQLNTKPAIASPVTTPATEETTKEWDRESASLEEQEKRIKELPVATPATEETTKERDGESASLEEQEKRIKEPLARNKDDFKNLRYLMEVKIKSRKLLEAVDVVDCLIALQVNDEEWPLLKGQILSFNGETETAYHGVVMANLEYDEPFDGVLKQIGAIMEKCKKEKNNSLLRDFKLLVAQVRVMKEKYGEAIKLYEELVKEEPRDFRPYLCRGIIYTLKLVPKNHPYGEYFLDNMFATQFFSEKVERGKVGLNS